MIDDNDNDAEMLLLAEMEPGHRVTGSAILAGQVGSRVIMSDPVFDPVLSFNVRVYRGVVSTEQSECLSDTISAN